MIGRIAKLGISKSGDKVFALLQSSEESKRFRMEEGEIGDFEELKKKRYGKAATFVGQSTKCSLAISDKALSAVLLHED